MNKIKSMRFTRLWNSEDDLRGNKKDVGGLYAIAQDNRGFVWFGGEDGLARYDGHDFDIYQHDENDVGSLSSNFIRDLYVDSSGVMWIATTNGLNRYKPLRDAFATFVPKHNKALLDKGHFTSIDEDDFGNLYVGSNLGLVVIDKAREQATLHTHDKKNPHSLIDNYVTKVKVDSKGRVWVGTAEHGVSIFNKKIKKFKHFKHDINNKNTLSSNKILDIEEDHLGNIWISTGDAGINKLDKSLRVVTSYMHDGKDTNTIGNNTVWDIFHSRQNELWFAVDKGGLAIFDYENETFKHFVHDAYDRSSINNNIVRTLFEDSNGDLWVGNSPSGVNHFSRMSSVFENIYHNPGKSESISHSTILSIEEDKQGIVWIGTEGGLNAYNPQTNEIERFIYDPYDDMSLASNAILSLEESSTGELWVGTWSGGLHRFNREGNTFTRYKHKPSDPRSLSNNFVWDIYEDKKGNLWIGTEGGGLNLYHRKTDSFTVYSHSPDDKKSISSDYVYSITEDRSGELWIGTVNGLNRMDRETGMFEYYSLDADRTDKSGFIRVNALLESKDRYLWVATVKGLFRIDQNRIDYIELNASNGLPSDTVSSLQEDDRSNIWASTMNGLVKINPKTLHVKTYTRSNGLASTGYNRDASHKSRAGELYFGGYRGVSRFKPEKIPENVLVPPIYVTDFKIFGRSVEIGDENSPLIKDISETNKINLTHEHTMISFEFTALNYGAPEMNQYAYKLDGLEKEWNYVGNVNSATYTNLRPGNYRFLLKAESGSGVWNENGPAIGIRIKPPIWKTPWAYMLYLSFFGFLCSIFLRLQFRKIDLNKERKVNAQLVRLDRLKNEFLSNTSHELRTPLNGILGLTESLISDPGSGLSDEGKYKLEMIAVSGKRLSRIINDILDFSKLAKNELELHLSSVDLLELTTQCITLLNDKTEGKNIEVRNKIDKGITIYADFYRVRQVLLYLLENAIKFTDSGYVEISYSDEGDHDKVSITDTGIGISEDDLREIFVSFQQLEGSASRNKEGTGLGLSVTKKLIELHGGELLAQSVLGDGSVFSFCLPKLKNEVINEPASISNGGEYLSKPIKRIDIASAASANSIQIKRKHQIDTVIYNSNLYISRDRVTGEIGKKKDYKILVVDDDPINRMVISAHLNKSEFTTVDASNGIEALKILDEQIDIDLIILDVMMPRMTGYEACEVLRKTYSIHQLPVIFLTAIHGSDEVIKGFSAGGNDFILKPVTSETLTSSVSTHLSLLEEFRELQAISPKVVDGSDKVPDEAQKAYKKEWPDFLSLKGAIKLIVTQMFNVLDNITSIGYWQLNPDDNFELIEFISSSQTHHVELVEYSNPKPISLNRFKKYVKKDNGGSSSVVFDPKRIVAKGLVGECYDGTAVLVSNAFCKNSDVTGFVIIELDQEFGDESLEGRVLRQFYRHIEETIEKDRLLDLV